MFDTMFINFAPKTKNLSKSKHLNWTGVLYDCPDKICISAMSLVGGPQRQYTCTPNCNNVVLEKWQKEKAKYELNRLIKRHSQGKVICSRCISPLEFSVLLSFSFKTVGNSNRQIRRPCVDAANEFIRLITQIDSFWLFPFFHFYMTTFFNWVYIFYYCNLYICIQTYSSVVRVYCTSTIKYTPVQQCVSQYRNVNINDTNIVRQCPFHW